MDLPRSSKKKAGKPRGISGVLVAVVVLLGFLGLVGAYVVLTMLVPTGAQVNPAPAVAPPPNPHAIPDFSGVDYTVDVAKLDYTKGPDGQPAFERVLPYRVSTKMYSQTLQGFLRLPGPPPAFGASVAGLGAGAPWAAAAVGAANQFVAHGKQTAYFPDDEPPIAKPGAKPRVFLEAYFMEGRLHGSYTVWQATGQMQFKTAYKEGQQHGIRTTWDAAGAKLSEEPYHEGKQHGPVRGWYADGKPRMEGFWVAGAQQGPWKKWAENGSQETVYWAAGVFEHRLNSRESFKWALDLTAQGRDGDGNLVYLDENVFHRVFGRPEQVKTHSAPRASTRLGEMPPPVFEQGLPGGQEWFYSCSDGTLGIRVESTNRGWVVHGGFIYLESK